MVNSKSIHLFAVTLLAASFPTECAVDPHKVFACAKDSGSEPLPQFPAAHSADVRVNFLDQQKTVELRHYKDVAGKREGFEVFSPGRHVKYIVHDKQHLVIKFPDNDYPTCSVTSSSTIQLEDEDSGPNGILQKLLDVSLRANEFYVSKDTGVTGGVFLRKWEGCFTKPAINVSYGFSEVDWKNPGNGTKNRKIPVVIEAQVKSDSFYAWIDNFQASMPEDIYFQPPEEVYCEGFREDKKPPEIKDYFSYEAEQLMFDYKGETAPIVLHRKVYFDYLNRIMRNDFYDLLPEVEDGDSKLKPSISYIIHDFDSKIQYFFPYPSLKCEVEEIETTESIIEEKNTKKNPMITAKQFFGLTATKISYNGQFMTRGYLADVFTAAVSHFDGSSGKTIYTWYFSAVETQLVENDKAEKNVLLRVVFHPESGSKRSDRIEMNIFKFAQQQPGADAFDISNCYDHTQSKLYVITFPANNALRGSENFLKKAVHVALMQFTGLSKQRITVSEVAFNKEYMFAEFKLLDSPSVLKKNSTDKGGSLAQAVAKLQAGVKDGSFQLSVRTDAGITTVVPLKSGFNEFSGDRKVQDPNTFSQGSVIGLTIGMILLGFVLGGVLLNLVVSRKYGVSLFQGKKGGMNNFNNPLNESNM